MMTMQKRVPLMLLACLAVAGLIAGVVWAQWVYDDLPVGTIASEDTFLVRDVSDETTDTGMQLQYPWSVMVQDMAGALGVELDAVDGEFRIELPQNTVPVTFGAEVDSGSIFFAADDSLMVWAPGALSASEVGARLPQDCNDDDVLVADALEVSGWKCMNLSNHPVILEIVDLLGGNLFIFTEGVPAAYPAYLDDGEVVIEFTVTLTNPDYAISATNCSIDAGANWIAAGGNGNPTCVWNGLDALADGVYTLWIEVCDDKPITPNCSIEGDPGWVFTVDTTAPVVDLSALDEGVP